MKTSCRVCNNKVVGAKIRKLFKEGCIKNGATVEQAYYANRDNCSRYNNKLVDGYKIVYKSLDYGAFKIFKKDRTRVQKVWKYVLEHINKIDKGWVYREYSGSHYGISKEFRVD